MVVTCANRKLSRRTTRLLAIGLLLVNICFLTFVTPAEAATGGSVMHVVRAGETLWDIGARYGVTTQQLIRINELSEPDHLVIGQKLVIREGEAQVHIVQKGETLSAIAQQYDVRRAHLIALNELSNPDMLSIGQELIIVPRWQRTHVVAGGDTLWDIARTYEVSVEALSAANSLNEANVLRIGKELVVPAIGGGDLGPVVPVSGRVTAQAPMLAWPVNGRVTSGFGERWGRMHYGIDIAAPMGTPVRAALGGTVTYSDWAGTYGMLVTIDHGGGVETRYAHNSQLLVKVGAKVQAGQRIALVGSTGASTGPHAHFEVLVNGERRDPLNRLPQR